MRLLKRLAGGGYELTKDLQDSELPSYAILSHTWSTKDDDEVTFADLVSGRRQEKAGWKKLEFCARRAAGDDLEYFWVDTCCIDKTDKVVLDRAIISMFRWYEKSAKCYVYLPDVGDKADVSMEAQLRRSRWLTRGWTLQELIAPKIVEFYDGDGNKIGDKATLAQELCLATGLPAAVLRGSALSSFTIEERIGWSASRETKLPEDLAYSLMGICDVTMVTLYGEGKARAMTRLRTTIYNEGQALGGGVRSEPKHATYKYLPLPRNRKFVGRAAVLGELEQKLFVTKETQKMAVVGLGGIGKTQVVLQYLHSSLQRHPEWSVFWISAMSMEVFEQGCREIAKIVDINAPSGEDIMEVVQRRLDAVVGGKWMLVVDNADDLRLMNGFDGRKGLLDYLPEGNEGLIIFTTRNFEVAQSSGSDIVELDKLSKDEALEVLTQALLRKDLMNDAKATSDMLQELDFLPLAITQAIAYINRNRISIAQYLELLRRTEQDLISVLSAEFRDHTRGTAASNAVATTWLVSFEQINADDVEAAEILKFMGCIEWKGIPLSILPQLNSKSRMTEALGTLCTYSLITKRDDAETYDMHRLVHLGVRVWMQRDGSLHEKQVFTMEHLANIFPNAKWEDREVWRAYMAHAFRIKDVGQDLNAEFRGKLCRCVGLCLRSDGRIREYVDWLQKSVDCLRSLPEDNLSRLRSQHALAAAYQANGQVREAVALLEHVVAVSGRTLAEDHHDRLASQHALAMAYQANGQVREAVALLKHVVVAVRERTLAEDHPDRLASQHALATAYQANGQVREAAALLEHVVAVSGRTLAEDHPDRLVSQHELARAYQANGQVREAVALLEHVVAVWERTLAEDHPDRLASQHALATAYRANGQVREAVALLEHVVAVCGRTLAEDHPHRLASQEGLAIAYWNDGQRERALSMMRHVVSVRKTSLHETHPARVNSEGWLAMWLEQLGQVEQRGENLNEGTARAASEK